MDLYIVRHAWAGHFGDPQWPDDFERPLSAKGAERFAAMANKLVGRGFLPQLVATSPLVRCRQTAELIVKCVGNAGDAKKSKKRVELVELDALMPGGDLDELLAWTAAQCDRCEHIAWVGHEPHMGRYAAAMIGGGCIRFAKGAVAAVKFDEGLQPGGGELRWLATAKMLGC